MRDRKTFASSAALWAKVSRSFSCVLEIDEAMVPGADWFAAQLGDSDAIERIKKLLHGEVLYVHAFGPPPDDWVKVTLRELHEIGAIQAVRLSRTINEA